jgi:hypothetical protein
MSDCPSGATVERNRVSQELTGCHRICAAVVRDLLYVCFGWKADALSCLHSNSRGLRAFPRLNLRVAQPSPPFPPIGSFPMINSTYILVFSDPSYVQRELCRMFWGHACQRLSARFRR